MFKKKMLLLCTSALVLASVTHAGPRDKQESVRQRRQWVGSSKTLRPFLKSSPDTAQNLSQAMDIDPSILLTTTLSGPAEANGALSNLGIIHPLHGSSFALLSTGVAATPQAEPGTDFSPTGTENDSSTLTLTLKVPAGSGRLSFSYNFLSAEYPEYINAGFNDTFTATLTDAQGSRIIAGANVDSAAFFPASESRASGSGFDLFTADTTGVNSDFGSTGFPDAGLTDFIGINVPFQSTGQITLQLSIADAGDGILDSAVLLDALTVSSIEVVDVVPDFFKNGSFVTDPDLLVASGQPRQGAAADGVTRVLVRTRVPGPGHVVFSLASGTAPQDGGFDQVGGSGRSASISVEAVSTPVGYEAFAVYRTPDEFNRGSDDSAAERSVVLKTAFTPASGGSATESQLPFQLVRPPLVFIHGLWSGPGTWLFPLAHDARFPSKQFADYQSTNASRFSTNAGIPPKFIQKAVEQLRLRQIAATQVDLIGHSMGGLLGRTWSAAAATRRDDNYRTGDIRKLLTLDTPHTGSPVANLLVTLRGSFLVGSVLTNLMRHFKMPIDEGAIDDLANGSAAIAAIPPASVPAHAFVGTGGSDVLSEVGGPLGGFYTIVTFFADVTGSTLFQGLQHDLIVGRHSQEGGLSGSATTAIGGFDGLHIGLPPLIPGNTASALYSAGIVGLLDTPISSSQFAHFPAPATLPGALAAPSSVNQALAAGLRAFKSVTPGLTITAPAAGTQVASGEVISVTIVPLPSVSVQRVLLVGPEVAQADAIAPFQIQLKIPDGQVGDITLTTVGANDQGELFTSNEVVLKVHPAAGLTSLEILPADPLLLGIDDSVSLRVIGHFADGVDRDLTDPSTGTVFSAVQPEIAAVSTTGVVTATQTGFTTILARNGDVQDSVTVTILAAAAPGPVEAIPTLSTFGLLAFLVLLALVALLQLRQRRGRQSAE